MVAFNFSEIKSSFSATFSYYETSLCNFCDTVFVCLVRSRVCIFLLTWILYKLCHGCLTYLTQKTLAIRRKFPYFLTFNNSSRNMLVNGGNEILKNFFWCFQNMIRWDGNFYFLLFKTFSLSGIKSLTLSLRALYTPSPWINVFYITLEILELLK